jgi:hypothetical protein
MRDLIVLVILLLGHRAFALSLSCPSLFVPGSVSWLYKFLFCTVPSSPASWLCKFLFCTSHLIYRSVTELLCTAPKLPELFGGPRWHQDGTGKPEQRYSLTPQRFVRHLLARKHIRDAMFAWNLMTTGQLKVLSDLVPRKGRFVECLTLNRAFSLSQKEI